MHLQCIDDNGNENDDNDDADDDDDDQDAPMQGPMGAIKEGDEGGGRSARSKTGAAPPAPISLEAPHAVRLTETSNHWIWSLAGSLVPASASDAAAVSAANTRYHMLLISTQSRCMRRPKLHCPAAGGRVETLSLWS